MKIHSSSLAYIPSGYKPANRNDQSQLPDSKKEKNGETSPLSASLPATVYEKANVTKLQLISEVIEQRQKIPSNSRTAYAVNAYIQENSQPLKNQRSELISGIDTFA
jgi:hypothetical protein